jgi:hypothetical protein
MWQSLMSAELNKELAAQIPEALDVFIKQAAYLFLGPTCK